MRQDGTRSYFFTLEEIEGLCKKHNFEVVKLDYVFRKTINKAEDVDVDRVFVQGVFKVKK